MDRHTKRHVKRQDNSRDAQMRKGWIAWVDEKAQGIGLG